MLVGHPVSQSLSPALQNAALKQRGLALRYETLDVSVSALDATLAELALEGAAGNVTIPHKISVALRARCTPLAARVGAVNTFWHENGVLHGENTDVAGVSAAVRALCPGGYRNIWIENKLKIDRKVLQETQGPKAIRLTPEEEQDFIDNPPPRAVPVHLPN